MKVNTSQNSILSLDFLTDLFRYRPWVMFFGIVYIVLAFLTFNSPFNFSLAALDHNSIQFAFSAFSMSLSFSIGIYLLFSDFRRSWGVSFLIYSITFLGLSLEALSISIADMTDPFSVLLWRLPMIIFIGLTLYGTISFYTDKRDYILFSSIGVALIGISWFIIGLGYLNNVELVMDVFLYLIFIPILLFSSFVWFKFNQETKFRSTSLLAIGYLLLGIIYSQWLPWQTINLNPGYNILYTLLTLAFVLIFRGYIQLTKENRNYA